MSSKEKQKSYDWTSIDWDAILPILNRYARNRLMQMRWFDEELEKVLNSEDFVFRAVEKTMSGIRPWKEEQRSLVKHLLMTIHSDIGHVAQSYENKSRKSINTIEDIWDDDRLQPDVIAQNEEEIEKLSLYVQSRDSEVAHVLEAMLEHDYHSNKELSQFLEIPMKDIVNAKRRLKRLVNDYTNTSSNGGEAQ